ncbi:putative HRDC domain protein [Desulfamplus magnetovallimortis]|uniref:Putative HRDC domain protein n=1 Tax=Desulfamplus magnetovallimortis TaxID=1246637 RepID=A0A1W1H535_9BACT|nr:HRDC domain-containing protein [Desulfamplus magnetovallimortis]SLM27478.1 putative HRDC domain protein [Desulfamplus magnetovallimortis]
MAVKILTVPFDNVNETFHDDILNQFMAGNIVKQVKYDFFMSCANPYWTVFIEYEPLFDTYENEALEELSAAEKELLEKLFEFRKKIAEKDGLPSFIVATNKQLKDVVKNRPMTIEHLKMINGFGAKKAKKYGHAIINIVKSYSPDKKTNIRVDNNNEKDSKSSIKDKQNPDTHIQNQDELPFTPDT